MSRGLDNFHSQYLYRVLRPNESPNQEIVCCDPSSPRTIDEHVETGLTQPSRFISTTSDSNAAHRWLITANKKSFLQYRNFRTVIVKIDVQLLKSRYSQIAAAAYDLSNSLNRNAFLKTEKQNKFSESYHEVVFMDRIPSDVFSTYSMSNNESDKESNSQISSASGFSAVPINLQQIEANKVNKPTPAIGTNSNSIKFNSLQSAMRDIDILNDNLDYPTNSQTSSFSNFSTLPVNRPQDGAPITYNPSLGRTLGAESSTVRSNYVQSASHINLFSTKANPEIDSKKAANLRKLLRSMGGILSSPLKRSHIETEMNDPIAFLSPESTPKRFKYLQSNSPMNKIVTSKIDSKNAANLRKLLGIDISPSPVKRPRIDTLISEESAMSLTSDYSPVEYNYSGSVSSLSKINQLTNDDLVDTTYSPSSMASDTSLFPVNLTSNDTSTTDKWASTISPVTSTPHLRRNLFKQDTHSLKFLRDQSTPDILIEKASSVREPRSKEFHSSTFLSNNNQSNKFLEKFKSKAMPHTSTPMAARTHSRGASKAKFDDETDEAFTPLFQRENSPST